MTLGCFTGTGQVKGTTNLGHDAALCGLSLKAVMVRGLAGVQHARGHMGAHGGTCSLPSRCIRRMEMSKMSVVFSLGECCFGTFPHTLFVQIFYYIGFCFVTVGHQWPTWLASWVKLNPSSTACTNLAVHTSAL